MNSKLIFTLAFCSMAAGVYGLVDSLLQRHAVEPAPVLLATQVEPVIVQPEPRPEMVRLYRLREGVERGQLFSMALVEPVIVEQTEGYALGFDATPELNVFHDGRLNRSLIAGEFVGENDITRPGEPGFLRLVGDPNNVLYPLSVSTRNQVKDRLRPGDYVDLIGISSPKSNLSNDLQTLPSYQGVQVTKLIENVMLVAVDGNIVVPIPVDGQQPESTEQFLKPASGEMALVIEVPPSEVGRLSLAQRTMYIEVYPSSAGVLPQSLEVRDVIANYNGVVELRGGI